MTTTITDLDDFRALDPFFRIIEKGLDGIADGPQFFDLLAEEVIFDYIITVPGYPRQVEGRQAVAELYRPYGTMIVLDRCHDLPVHHDTKTGVVVLEYASEGRVVSTGAPYTDSTWRRAATIASRCRPLSATAPWPPASGSRTSFDMSSSVCSGHQRGRRCRSGPREEPIDHLAQLDARVELLSGRLTLEYGLEEQRELGG
jgi:hypothetical protein